MDEAFMVQKRAKASDFGTTGKNGTRKLAMTFEGGGFKAHSAFTGVMSGLLGASGLGVEKLLHAVEVLVSISGGTWFAAQLIYSPAFLSLVEEMGKKPEDAGKLFWKSWVVPFLESMVTIKSTGSSSPWDPPKPSKVPQTVLKNDRFHELPGREGKPGIWIDFVQILFEVIYAFIHEHGNWEDFVGKILNTMRDVSSQATLGSKTNPWASSKTWLVSVSVASAGNGTGPGSCASSGFRPLCIAKAYHGGPSVGVYRNGTFGVTYSCPSSRSRAMSSWAPAAFSVKLGVPEAPSATFCHDCQDLEIRYTGVTRTKGDPSATSRKGDLYAFGTGTPVIQAVAASSAFLGPLSAIPLNKEGFAENIARAVKGFLEGFKGIPDWFADFLSKGLQNALDINWIVWAQSADSDKASFQDAVKALRFLDKSGGEVGQQELDMLAKKSFFGIADGGVGDNSGIGHSLAAGADEIIVFADMPTSVSQTGKQKGSRQIFDVPLVDLCPLCYANFQLFEESKEEIDTQWEKQQTLFYLPPETTTLNSLSIGSLQLTTAQNDYFGTSGGRSVKVHVISVLSGLGIGGKAYEDYATFLKDIIGAFARSDNQDKVQEILNWLQ
ncbi:unnamed protein product [Symbiodinium sp. CCMP2592]|nr:unnamed protein product [Symbiodinium sp. CCMP2592]